MNENGAQNNQGYGFTEEDRKVIDEMRARINAEAESKRIAEERKAKLSELRKDENYSVFKQGGLEEMIEKNPEILDSPMSLKLAMDNSLANIKLREAEKAAQQIPVQTAPAQTEPASPAGIPTGNTEDQLTEKEFFDRVALGTATRADLDKVKGLNPYTRYEMRRILKNNIAANADVIAKGRAALGSE